MTSFRTPLPPLSHFFYQPPPPFSNLGMNQRSIYIIRSISRQQLFHYLRAHQRSSDQMKVMKDQSECSYYYQSSGRSNIYIYIYIYIYINFKAINNVLDTKMVLKTYLFIKILRLLYRSFVFIYASMYILIYMAA